MKKKVKNQPIKKKAQIKKILKEKIIRQIKILATTKALMEKENLIKN